MGRHASYSIGTKTADRWVGHMELAMERHESLGADEEARAALLKYFRYTAYYIVVASEYMRPDQVSLENRDATAKQADLILRPFCFGHIIPQLSGGTEVDAGRVW